MSESIAAITGHPASDFIGNRVRTYASVIHPEDSPTVDEVVGAAVAEARPYTVEYRVMLADGRSRWVTEHGRPHVSRSGTGADWLDGVILPRAA